MEMRYRYDHNPLKSAVSAMAGLAISIGALVHYTDVEELVLDRVEASRDCEYKYDINKEYSNASLEPVEVYEASRHVEYAISPTEVENINKEIDESKDRATAVAKVNEMLQGKGLNISFDVLPKDGDYDSKTTDIKEGGGKIKNYITAIAGMPKLFFRSNGPAFHILENYVDKTTNMGTISDQVDGVLFDERGGPGHIVLELDAAKSEDSVIWLRKVIFHESVHAAMSQLCGKRKQESVLEPINKTLGIDTYKAQEVTRSEIDSAVEERKVESVYSYTNAREDIATAPVPAIDGTLLRGDYADKNGVKLKANLAINVMMLQMSPVEVDEFKSWLDFMAVYGYSLYPQTVRPDALNAPWDLPKDGEKPKDRLTNLHKPAAMSIEGNIIYYDANHYPGDINPTCITSKVIPKSSGYSKEQIKNELARMKKLLDEQCPGNASKWALSTGTENYQTSNGGTQLIATREPTVSWDKK